MPPPPEAEDTDPRTGKRIVMAHPAYDQCIKASTSSTCSTPAA
jgi:hypothetical protein